MGKLDSIQLQNAPFTELEEDEFHYNITYQNLMS